LKPVVLVTGGSRGIGAAAACLAAQQGWAVAVNYTQDAAAAQAVVARIQGAGGLAMAVKADVGNEAQVLAMFAQIDQALPAWGGHWAGLVNSAGGGVPPRTPPPGPAKGTPRGGGPGDPENGTILGQISKNFGLRPEIGVKKIPGLRPGPGKPKK
jgi:NAD(P)-dependent dehydrogenase (short-subunit alcohol dehydrogenase family)